MECDIVIHTGNFLISDVTVRMSVTRDEVILAFTKDIIMSLSEVISYIKASKITVHEKRLFCIPLWTSEVNSDIHNEYCYLSKKFENLVKDIPLSKNIVLTGYGFCGSLAVYAGWVISSLTGSRRLRVINFGSLPIGNSHFLGCISFDVCRVVLCDDIAPRMENRDNVHVGRVLCFDRAGFTSDNVPHIAIMPPLSRRTLAHYRERIIRN
jgi:hypothetical protein